MSKPEPLRPKKRPASAIILALAVIALVSVVTLTMSSLSQLEERTSTVKKESILARKNALLGLKIAVGQIQENLGVDQAITLNARHYNRHDADATNDTKDYAQAWTAALPSTGSFKWESPDEGDPPVWLVSGNGIASTPSIKPDTDLESLPHAELGVTYTNRVESISVKAPLRNASVHASSGKPTGRYAYWVDDEGMKARVNYFDIGMHADRTDGYTGLRLTLTSTPKTGIEVLNIPSEGDTEVPTLDDRTGRHDYQKGLIGNRLRGSDDEENGGEVHPFASFFYPWSEMIDDENNPVYSKRRPQDLNRLHSVSGLENWLEVPNIYQLRETLTFSAHGVLSDTKDGGLKQDLSYLFVADPTDDAISNRLGSTEIFDTQAGVPTGRLDASLALRGLDQVGLDSSWLGPTRNPLGPKWKQLIDGAQAFDRLGDYRPWTLNEHGYTGGSWLWGIAVRFKVDAWKEGIEPTVDGPKRIYKYKLIAEYQVYGDRNLKPGVKPYMLLKVRSNAWSHYGNEAIMLKLIIKTVSGDHDYRDGNPNIRAEVRTINVSDLRVTDQDGEEIPEADRASSLGSWGNEYTEFDKEISFPWSRGVDEHKWPEVIAESRIRTIKLKEHKDAEGKDDPWKIDFAEINPHTYPFFDLVIWKSFEDYEDDNPPVQIIRGLSRKAYPYLVRNDHPGLESWASAYASKSIDDDSADFEADLTPEAFRYDGPNRLASQYISARALPLPRQRQILFSYYWGLPKFWSARLMQPMLGTPIPYTSRYNAYGPSVGIDLQTGQNPIYRGGHFSRAALRHWVGDLPPVEDYPKSILLADEPRDTTASPNLDRRVAAYDPHWFLEGFRQEYSILQYGVSQTLPEFSQIKFPWAPELNYPRKAPDKASIYDRTNTPQLLTTLGNGAEVYGPATRQPDTNISPNTDRNGINIAWQFRNVQPRPVLVYSHENSNIKLNKNAYPHHTIPTNPIGNSWLPAWFGLDSSHDRANATALAETHYTEPEITDPYDLQNFWYPDREFTYHDWCYKLNEALWDRYFFSRAINQLDTYYSNRYQQSGDYGPINRFTVLNDELDAFSSGNAIDTFDKAAANALSTWVLNVNTPHIDGWKNAIGARWNHLERDTVSIPEEFDLSGGKFAWLTAIIKMNPDINTPRIYGSFGTPSAMAENLAKSSYFNADDNYAFALDHRPTTDARARHAASPLDTDLRRGGIYHNGPAALLNLRHVNSIARILTEQVAVRGPYKSLGQFINRDKDAIDKEGDDEDRKLQNRRRQIEGVLQYAIDESGANDFLFAAEDGIVLPGFSTFSNTASNAAIDAYWKSGYKLDYFNPTTNTGTKTLRGVNNKINNTTYRTYYIFHGKKMSYRAGIPAYVSQAKLLESIGHIITPRSDTFTIHFYGESTNPITGEPEATARGKAVVQRLPEFIDSANKPWDWSRSGTKSNASPRDATVNDINLRFGRRFIITSIRWE